MRLCTCGERIPCKIKVDGRWRNLKSRIRCLSCSPFNKKRERIKFRSKEEQHNKNKVWYYSHKEKTGMNPTTERRIRNKKLLLELFGGCCSLCGYNKVSRNMSFHHVDPKTKMSDISSEFVVRKLQIVLAEIQKCILVCVNCHGEIEVGIVNSDTILRLNEKVLQIISKFSYVEWNDWYDAKVAQVVEH